MPALAVQTQELKISFVNSERVLRGQPARPHRPSWKPSSAKGSRRFGRQGAGDGREAGDRTPDLVRGRAADRQRHFLEQQRDLEPQGRRVSRGRHIQRRNEELSAVVEKDRDQADLRQGEVRPHPADGAIPFSARVDITDKVLDALNRARQPEAVRPAAIRSRNRSPVGRRFAMTPETRIDRIAPAGRPMARHGFLANPKYPKPLAARGGARDHWRLLRPMQRARCAAIDHAGPPTATLPGSRGVGWIACALLRTGVHPSAVVAADARAGRRRCSSARRPSSEAGARDR